jgi:prepilin-type N-terminal cleavage/methylation domain-containing protein
MRRNNRKGFTIVELVIVIAVIAILAGVLIPTFAGITTKAKKSAALQEATNAYKEAYAEAISDGKIDADDNAVKVETTKGDWTFDFSGATVSVTEPNGFEYTVEVENGTVKISE